MYSAYTLESVLQNLPSTFSIECAAIYKDTLLLGTKQGQLVTFRVTETAAPNAESPLNAKLDKTERKFSTKPVSQLFVVEEHQLLFSLSDQTLSVRSISDTFPIIEEFKGVTAFACGTQIVPRHNDGLDNVEEKQKNYTMVRLCVAVRRKIQFYYWSHSNRTFIHHPYEHTLPDIPKTMIWSNEEFLMIGFRSEYIRLKTNRTGEIKELFGVGRQHEPLIAKLREHSLAMLLDKQLILVQHDGTPSQKFGVQLNDVPVSVAYDYPYLMALSPSGLEVHTINPLLTVQDITIQTPKPLQLLVWKPGKIFIISSNNIWCLIRTPVTTQLQACQDRNQYHLASKLLNILNAPEDEKLLYHNHVMNRLAFSFFVKGKFDKAFKIFENLRTDPLHVIGLLPSLLKDQYRSALQYPEAVPTLTEEQLEKAMSELISHLTAVRRSVKNHEGDTVKVTFIKDGEAIRQKTHLLQIIETTLLHLYIKCRPNLLKSFLRFKDNHCHFEESEALLIEHNKIEELILLYEQKGAHRKALQLLFDNAATTSSPLFGHERTVKYLQGLTEKDFDLILEYARYVLDAFPDDGLKIFTESKNQKTLPRDKVIQFLDRESRVLVLSYLEHVVLKWKDNTVQFHNMLIHKYREQILRLADGGTFDTEEIVELRSKLSMFLRTSDRYTLSMFPQYFLDDKLYFECAIVMGKLGRHQDALAIYIHVLQDLKSAEAYCLEQYRGNKASERDMFVILLRLYITPPEICLNALDISAAPSSQAMPDILEVLDILERHVDKLEPLRVIEILPAEVPLHKLMHFLSKLLNQHSTQLSKLRLYNALLTNANIKAKQKRQELVKSSVIIDELKLCDICNRRIMQSVFVQTEQGAIVHYACHNKTFLRGDSIEE